MFAKLSCTEDPTLEWRHNGHDSVSHHQAQCCLLNRLFRGRSTKTSKLRVTGLCAGNSPGTGEFPAQMTSNAENVSIWWRHHGKCTHGSHYVVLLWPILPIYFRVISLALWQSDDCLSVSEVIRVSRAHESLTVNVTKQSTKQRKHIPWNTLHIVIMLLYCVHPCWRLTFMNHVLIYVCYLF